VVKIKKQGAVLFVQEIVLNHHAEKVLQSLEDAAREQQAIVLDLEDLEFNDDHGAQRLFQTMDSLQKRGCRTEVWHAQEKVLTRLVKAGILPHKMSRQRAG